MVLGVWVISRTPTASTAKGKLGVMTVDLSYLLITQKFCLGMKMQKQGRLLHSASQFTYALTGGGGSNNITGPFTKFDQSDVNSIQSTSSSLASATSLTAGWIASSASTFAAAPSPYAPAFGTVALVATATGVAADGVSQLVSPNIGGYLTYNVANVVGNKVLTDKYPLLAPVFNATVNYF